LFDEITNEALCAYAACSEDSTELEIELAHRLNYAMAEIGTLVAELQKVRCDLGDGA